VPGETTIPESTRPGLRAFRSTCASAVSQEVLAPFRVARSLSPNRVDTAGRARGLCGAPDGARGRRADSLALHRLDPDGWLVQSSTDTNPIQSPAAQQRAESATLNPPSPRSGSPGPSLAKPCPLDTRLLMGGTIPSSGHGRGCRSPQSGIRRTFLLLRFQRGGIKTPFKMNNYRQR